MNIQVLDPVLVIVLLLNFFILVSTRMRSVVNAVAVQGALLGAIYPAAHWLLEHGPEVTAMDKTISLLRLLSLTFAVVAIKGFVIPKLLYRAMREVQIGEEVQSLIGPLPTLLIGAVGTALSVSYGQTLPLREVHASALVVPAALATCFCGFLVLTTRRKALSQVMGYLVLENGIFAFGLLLVGAMPELVEAGVLLDLFVGVFVMGIIINHVNQEFPSASSEHLTALRE